MKNERRLLVHSKILYFSCCVILAIAVLILALAISENPHQSKNSVPIEQEHMYSKNVECVVIDISKREWFAGYMHKEITIVIYNDEYNLKETLILHDMDCDKYWNVSKGDTVTAELLSWVYDSTGEITRRRINQLR